MKKPPKSGGKSSWPLKLDLKMKLSLLLLITVTFVMQANSSYSQKTKITLDLGNTTVEEVLDEIEANTEFKFIFSTKTVDLKRKVSINVREATIKRVLQILFTSKDIIYDIEDRKILLKKKEFSQKVSNSEPSPEIDGGTIQFQVSGNIRDTEGEPLPGASIVEKGTTNGTQSDFDGNYVMAVANGNAVLIVSYIGYGSKEVSLNGQSVLNVELEESAAGLEEVVVVGYGTMKKADLTGSVSQVKSETLESVPVYNMAQALKVGASGVRVSQNSGTPGSRIEVRIRGGNSLIGNNQPLYVVDGFPVTSGIDYLNPADIESVDILKDASATAIYGSRGANGVVIITSKRGVKNQESKIEVNNYFGMQQAINEYDLLDAKEYAIVANEWLKNEGLEPNFNVDEIQNPGTDWLDVI